jgi:hypothetical protein
MFASQCDEDAVFALNMQAKGPVNIALAKQQKCLIDGFEVG